MKNVNNRQKKVVVPKPAFKKQSLKLLRQLAHKKSRLFTPPNPVTNPGSAEDLETDEGKVG